MCHLPTVHNVSLSRFGESDNVGTPCISCGDVGIDSCSTAFQFHKYYLNVMILVRKKGEQAMKTSLKK